MINFQIVKIIGMVIGRLGVSGEAMRNEAIGKQRRIGERKRGRQQVNKSTSQHNDKELLQNRRA